MHKIPTPNPEFYYELAINPELDAEGMVTPQYKLDVGSKETVFVIPGKIGLIQFKSKDKFRAGIMSHEALHCATSYLRLFDENKLKLSDEIDDNEEELAYLVGWFTSELTQFYYSVLDK